MPRTAVTTRPQAARTPQHARGRRAGRLAAMLACLGLAGCGGSSELPLAEVTGTVTYKGEPLETGTVVFIPQGGTPGPQATGQIQAGSYRMQTNDESGAAVGTHKVTVVSRSKQSEADYKALKIPKMITPAKYASETKTPLTFEVKSGANVYDIPLED